MRASPMLLVALAACACASGGPAATGRPQRPAPAILYVVGCDAQVDRVDATTGRRLSRTDLAPRLPLAHGQAVAGATFDGCLMNGAAYDAAHAAFYTVVPDQFSDKDDGTKDYHIARVRVPALAVTIGAAAGEGLDAAPAIAVDAGGAPRIAPTASADPSTVERSGSATLVRMPAAPGAPLALGVRRGGAAPVALTGLPRTRLADVHLAPGGGEVVAEETGAGDARTGRLVVLDSASGKALRTVDATPARAMALVAITPSGSAIYGDGDGRYLAVPLGGRYSDATVTRAMPASAATFIADR